MTPIQIDLSEIVKIIGSQLSQLDACEISKDPNNQQLRALWQLADHIIDILENGQRDWITDVIIDFIISHELISDPLSRIERSKLMIKAGKAARLILNIRNQRNTI